MTLYDEILEYEYQLAVHTLREINKENKVISKGLAGIIHSAATAEKEKARVLLDKAHALNGSQLADIDLDDLLAETEKVDNLYFGRVTTTVINFLFGRYPEIKNSKKGIIKETISLYQQLIKQDNSLTFEEAVKLQFGTEEAYRKALTPLIEMERIYMDAAISRLGFLSSYIASSMKVVQNLRENSAKYIFKP